jgi:hypothetical protein
VWLSGGYFDESFDEGEERCYTIAGYVGPQLPAVVLDLRCKALLKRYDLDYFKASEIELGFGEFEKHRDDPKNLAAPLSTREKNFIREIKTAFVDLICAEDHIVGMSASVLLKDYSLLKTREPDLFSRLPNPYTLCGHLVLMEAGFAVNWSNENFSQRALLRPIFDSHQDYSFRFQTAFDDFCSKNPNCSRFLLKPIYEKEQDYRCLQAADCLAYEARRFVDKSINTPLDPRPERIAIQRLKEQMSAIYYLDYEALKNLAANQKPIEPVFQKRKRRGGA